MKILTFIFLSVLFTTSVMSCTVDDDISGTVCTEEFVTHSITVLEPNGQPADSVNITVRNEETGNIYDICQDYACDSNGYQGRYVIFHDGFQGKISEEQEDVVVNGSKDSLSFSEDFSFFDDGCHVRKLAGPDTVWLR